ncbi:aminotransferase class IV [Bifidobacterium colobi]|nr:aminotransferase class IV [Bifidobacterium colobi]
MHESLVGTAQQRLLHGAKTLSYAFNCAVHRECDRRGVDDAILFTEDGCTLECPNSSIVVRYGDTLITPDPRIGILHGTSQRELFAWALQEGQHTYYKKLPFAELREADRLYMVHGGWVIPVNELDGQTYDYDSTEIETVNTAIHTGRTHDDALAIGPSSDYE